VKEKKDGKISLFLLQCDTTWSVVRQWLGKHVFPTTDTHGTMKDIARNGVFYAVHAEAI
jgi:hypothetical protein